METTKSRRDLYENLGDSGAGIHFVLTTVVFTLAGMGLDRLFESGPVLTVILGVVGFVGGFFRVVYWEQYEDARRRTLGLPERQQREVPQVLRDKVANSGGSRMRGDVTGIETMDDYKPRRFGDRVPESLVRATPSHPRARGSDCELRSQLQMCSAASRESSHDMGAASKGCPHPLENPLGSLPLAGGPGPGGEPG